MARVPEGFVVQGVLLFGNRRARLSPDQTKALSANLAHVYARIAADPQFAGIPSALPYCLSDVQQREGHYFAYYPPKIDETSPSIVFLHGFGGNFQFYTWLLKEEFPDHVILAPSWGASWHDGTEAYIEDMFRDVREKHSFMPRTPALIAISAGGPAGFRIYNRHPDRYSKYVCIASAPSPRTIPRLNRGLEILMLNGTLDRRFPFDVVSSRANRVARNLPRFKFETLKADHFFLLSHRRECFGLMKEFLSSR